MPAITCARIPGASRLPVPFRLTPLCVALTATMLCSSLALADEIAIELAPLVITGASHHAPLTVITDPKQPRQPMPAADGADYLKTIPGFNAIRNGGANGDPLFRGMFGSRLNILMDGGQMLGACPNRMDTPTSYLSPENFDQLTVIKGPQSVLWGPGASAATILFERDTAPFNELGGRVDGSILAASNGRFDRRIDATAGGSQGYLRVLANKAQADDYQDGNGDSVPSRWDKWNSDVLLGWTPDDDTLIELSAGRGDGEARYAGRGMDGSQFLRESLGLRFKKDNIGELFSALEGQVYYNYADHVMDNFSLRSPNPLDVMAPMRNPLASNVDRRTLGGRLVGTWDWQAVELKAGVDGQTNEHRKRASSFNMLSRTYTDYDQAAWDKDAVFHNYGLFGELTWKVASRQRWIAGARLDRASVKDYRQTLGSGMTLRANPTADETRSATLPSGFLRYERDLVGMPAIVYAGLGHTQRFPDYWELFSASPGPIGFVQPMESLDPEKTTQLDFGAHYRGAKLDAWASAYLGQVRDYIQFSYGPGMMPGHTRSQASNIDARIMGGELGASYRLSRNWKTDASLAYAWGKNSSDGRPLAQTPPLEARFGLGYEQSDWSAGALWRVVAAQNRVDEGKGNVVGKDFGNSSGFAVFSLNAAYRLTPEMKLSAGVDNLFDKAYSEHLNLAGNAGFGFSMDDPQAFNEPGRTLWTKVDFSF
ncbi:MAG: TonB-dependent copper receptor [Pseudotabrizicola sp.]|uniref:TonB-dependent copper receptor n=1 Tax=Pseudotabrizicola sp. TaxID=2939647 RepID=UPI0027291D42|nr:TonB-dependent copper receptor [Pseudotabrizicola sp.]MDO9638225.1 TonB-dependent copper receptor [Pseudotabrizicola sp.]